jgi:dTDP-4-amino-4,6-dideoxygalactose transaminase
MEMDMNMTNMIGLNFRMTEIEAGIGRIQLQKLPVLVKKRLANIIRLEERLRNIDFLSMPTVRAETRHVFYVHAMKFDKEKAMNVSREKFVEAINKELMPTGENRTRNSYLYAGYTKPLYKLKLFQKHAGLGSMNFPFNFLPEHKMDYSKVKCAVAEKMHFNELIYHDLIHASLEEKDIDDIASAFLKVAENLSEL